MAFVLDASAALPWCFRDEATQSTESLLALAALGTRIYVPAHWPLEILNGLTRAARRGRLTGAAVDSFLDQVKEFNIAVDVRPMGRQWTEALSLIRRYQLNAYDAPDLSLAKVLDIPLATLDDQLRRAAVAEGVPLLL